jgi:hypothetical protein
MTAIPITLSFPSESLPPGPPGIQGPPGLDGDPGPPGTGVERYGVLRPELIGILPNLPAVDCGPLLQAACDAVTADEVLFDFGPGIYYIGTPVTWNKRVRILGAGERLTHFRCWPQFSTGDVFVSGADGCAFENIQFSSATPRTSGAYLRFNHNYCRALNVWATDGFGLVDVQANACWVDRLGKFVWSTDPAAYSVRVASPHKLMRNIGYVTENCGTATIPSGSTSVQVSHGLDVIPHAGKINLTPTNGSSNPGILRVTDIGAAGFTIRCLADPGASGLNIAWSYRE